MLHLLRLRSFSELIKVERTPLVLLATTSRSSNLSTIYQQPAHRVYCDPAIQSIPFVIDDPHDEEHIRNIMTHSIHSISTAMRTWDTGSLVRRCTNIFNIIMRLWTPSIHFSSLASLMISTLSFNLTTIHIHSFLLLYVFMITIIPYIVHRSQLSHLDNSL